MEIALDVMGEEPAAASRGVLDLQRNPTSKTIAVRTVGGSVVETAQDDWFGSTGVAADAQDGDDLIIKVDNVHKSYLMGVEAVPALRGVSLSVRRGEFVCLFGTSGGGKTTLLNVLGTIDKPSRGYLTVCGTKIGSSTSDRDLSDLRLNRIGFVFQTFNLLGALTALENVEMPMILSGRLSAAQRRARAVELLTSVGMQARLDHVPSQLSGGEQQRVTIARALANRPDILLLDEPTGDLDSANTLNVLSLLTSLNRKERITLVLVTHDISIKYFADRVLWLRDGKLQRVEVVSERKRNDAYANLARDMEALRLRTGANRGQQDRRKDNPWANTAVRKPTDYECVRGIMNVDVNRLEADLKRNDKSFADRLEAIAVAAQDCSSEDGAPLRVGDPVIVTGAASADGWLRAIGVNGVETRVPSKSFVNLRDADPAMRAAAIVRIQSMPQSLSNRALLPSARGDSQAQLLTDI